MRLELQSSYGVLQALPLGLTALHLSTCERLQGGPLSQLIKLRSLRLSGCPAVTQAAVQVWQCSHVVHMIHLYPAVFCPIS